MHTRMTTPQEDNFALRWQDQELLEERKDDQKAYYEWYQACLTLFEEDERANRRVRRAPRRKTVKKN